MKQAAVLKKLGVNPLESLIKIHFAWSDGDIIPKEVLYMDVEAFLQNIISGYKIAQKVALDIGIIDKETLEPLIQKAHREALAALFELPIIDDGMIEEYVRKAELNANILRGAIIGIGSETPKETKKSKTKEKKAKKDEDEDEDEGVGIGGLFG